MNICNLPREYRRAGKIAAREMLGEYNYVNGLNQGEAALARIHRKAATALLVDGLIHGDPSPDKVYVSTPITGGERLYGFLEEQHVHNKKALDPAQMASYNKQVIAGNCEHAQSIAADLRKHGACVVSPSAIALPGWSQTKYNQNWMEVVKKVPFQSLVVCDGWQLSYGCLLEVRTALDKGTPVRDEQNHTINRAEALARVQASTQEWQAKGFDLAHLSRALTDPLSTLPMEA